MIQSNAWNREINKGRWRIFFTSSYFSMVVIVIALLLGGVVIALLLGGAFGKLGSYASWATIVTMAMALIIVLRQNELAATLVVVLHMYVDWYLQLYVVAPVLGLALLLIFFLARSPQYPWASPDAIWLWVLFLGLSIFPAIQGATDLSDALYYYPNIVLGSLIVFWLGIVIARDLTSVRLFFKVVSLFGMLIALHTIITALTGTFLLATPRINTYLASVNDFTLVRSSINRVGSFLGNPDWNGTFLSMMVFVPVGLLVSTSSQLARLIYLGQIVLILLALLFTYTTLSWIAVIVGLIPLFMLIGPGLRRVWFPALLGATIVGIYYVYPNQSTQLVLHSIAPNDAQLRMGAWQTAWRVIQAFPLTGVGLGLYNYLLRAEPYRVPAQYAPLAHPHNAYLELGAMAGLPVLIVFIALLSLALGFALRNWAQVDVRSRSLLSGGIAAVVALCINSGGINGWTLPPIAATGWLILGVISSPQLARSRKAQIEQEKSDT